MENTITTPAFSFTENSIKSFDIRMEKIGFIYEGTLFDNIWIYRKSKNEFVSIQVGLGGVLFVKINKSDECGNVKNTPIDLGKVNTPVKLTNFIGKLF